MIIVAAHAVPETKASVSVICKHQANRHFITSLRAIYPLSFRTFYLIFLNKSRYFSTEKKKLFSKLIGDVSGTANKDDEEEID